LSTSFIAIGCDSSKGRIDVVIRNTHGTVLHTGAFDDTPDDHAAVRQLVDGLRERFPKVIFLVGIESTGGMERNWLSFFKKEKRWAEDMRVFKLSATSVNAFRLSQLHRAPGDVAAASDIADYLLERCRTRTPVTEADSGPLVFYRMIRALIGERICSIQRLQTLLVAVHPDLVRFTRYGFPAWMLLLLERYPTASHLARAQVDAVDAIPHIDTKRAEEIIAHAKESVASLTDVATAAAIRLAVGHIRNTDERIEAAQTELLTIITADPQSQLAKAVALLDGIPGIGPWSAACLACEIGDPKRFAHDKALIAWAGLDPVTEASGDEQRNLGISHRGNAHVRAMLFPLAMGGIKSNPVLKAFFERLTTINGKTKLAAMVAVMAKILRIAYAILISNKAFNPTHEADRKKNRPSRPGQPHGRARSHTGPTASPTAGSPHLTPRSNQKKKSGRARRDQTGSKSQAHDRTRTAP
jgi:transposase